jgi:Na+:H+ antiporter, NhaA family
MAEHHSPAAKYPKPIRFLLENSVFLIAGAVIALAWANFDTESYQKFVHFDLLNMEAVEHEAGGHAEEAHDESEPDQAAAPADEAHADDHAGSTGWVRAVEQVFNLNSSKGEHFNVHFLINDILMALFFAIAGKEVFESLLPGGALSNPRKAATPLMATLGGIVGPAGIYAAGVLMFSDWDILGKGWAIPCATDIAFSYLVARLIFGPGHPAIAFLLLLAIADDAAGLMILAIFYPTKDLELVWLLLTLFACVLCFVFRRMRLHNHWWYIAIPGSMSFISFCQAGIHPALGLVPVIFCLPHAHTDLGIFAQNELGRHDTLNEFEHWWKNPVELILGMFGLANAGVVMSSVGTGTWLVLAGLLIGKPLGVTLMTWVAEKVFRLERPAGMGYAHVLTLGMIAGIGFTVALFVSTAAFRTPGPVQDSVKMGALLSFGAAPLSFLIAKLMGIKPLGGKPAHEPVSEAPHA